MAIRTTGVRYDVIARDSASRTFKTVGDSAGRLQGGLGKLAKTAAYAGAALAGGVAAGLAVSATKAVAFEATMKRVQTQAGATAKDVGTLSKQVLALGKSTQQGPQQLAEALYHLKSVGMDNAAAMKSLKTASDLAAVGNSDLESTTNALAGAWRTGIKGASTFSKAAGVVNATIGAGNMTMEQFTEAIGTGILPSAKSFGLSLNQVGAALALMTDEGIPAVDAATRLRMSFSLLGAPSSAAEVQLKKIGLTGLDLAKAMRGPDGIIGAVSLLKDHLDKSGLSAAQESQILSRAFGGGRSSSGILTLVNNLDVLKKKQDQVNGSTGKFGSAVIEQRKTAAAQLKLLESNLQVLEIQVGTKVLPVLSGFVQFLSRTALPAAVGFGTTLAHRFIPVDQIKSGFTTVSGMVGDFFDGLRGPKTIHLPTPALRMATTPIPAGLAAPKSAAQKLGDQLHGVLSGGLGNALKGINWSQLGKSLGNGLGTAFAWLTSHGASLVKKLTKAIAAVDWVNVGAQLGNVAIPMAIGIINHLFDPLFTVSFWQKHWFDVILATISIVPVGKLAGVGGKLLSKVPWGKLGEVLGELLDHVPWSKAFRWTHWIGDSVGEALSAAGQFVKRLATGFGDAFATRFPTVAQAFEDQMILLPDRLGDIGRMLMSSSSRMVVRMGDAIVKNVPLMGNKFFRAIAKTFGRYTLYQQGILLISGMLNGIGTKMKDIGSWLKSHLVDPIVNSVKKWFKIKSPSRVFAGIGGHLVAGLMQGLATSNGLDIAKTVFGDLPSALAAIVGRGLVHIEQLPGRALKALQGLGSKGAKLLGSAANSLFGGGSTAHMSDAMAIGQRMMLARGIPAGQWSALRQLWSNESGWRVNATNPTSGAYGIPQALPGKKMAAAGADWRTNPATQIAWGLDYIQQRYGTPALALARWQANSPHWYAKGGLAPIGQTAWVGERGPELMQVTSGGTRIFSNKDSLMLAKAGGIQVPGYASGTVAVAERRVSSAREELERARERRYGVQAAETRYKAALQELANARAAGRDTVRNALQNGFLKTLETGTAAAIASAVKGMNAKLQAAGAGSMVAGNLRTAGRLESLAGQRSAVQGRIAQAQQYASDQSSSLSDYLSVSNTPAASISSLISRMQARQATAASFATEVAGLSKKGLNKDLLGQLAQQGPGSQLATLLSTASASDIAQLNKVAASQAKLTTSFGQTMANAMYDSGSQAGKGFLSGLKAQEAGLQAEMDKLAAGMVKAIKAKLGIHSPSTVFRDEIGRQVVLGTVAGVRMHAPKASAEVRRMADTMAAVRARTGVLVGASAGPAPAVHHHHETHYTINARTADFTRQDLEVVQRQAEARQRVGRPR